MADTAQHALSDLAVQKLRRVQGAAPGELQLNVSGAQRYGRWLRHLGCSDLVKVNEGWSD